MNKRTTIAFAVLSLLAACGGGGGVSNGTATVTGTIRGQSLPVADVISAAITTTAQGLPTIGAGVIGISSNGNLCSQVSAGKQPKNTKILSLGVTDVNTTTGQTTAPTGAGTYNIFTGGQLIAKLAFAAYSQTDANCHDVVSAGAAATSGTVTLTSVSGGSYSGMFDLNLNSGDHITGSFGAANCGALATLVNQGTTLTCN